MARIQPRGINFQPRDSVGSLLNLSSQGFQQASQAATNYGERIKKQAIDKQINELLQLTPTVGNQETSASQTPLQFQQQQQTSFSGVDGIDPLTALGLAQKQSQPYYDQSKIDQSQGNADRLFGLNSDKFDETQLQNERNNSYQDSSLVQKADAQQATDGYRADNLTETTRHNKATEANQLEGFKTRHSTRQLDPSTKDKNNAQTNKVYDDIAYKTFGDEGYKLLKKLAPEDRKRIYDYWRETGIIAFDDGVVSWGSDNEAKSTVPSDWTPSQSLETYTSESTSKTIVQRFPDGSVLYDDDTVGTE